MTRSSYLTILTLTALLTSLLTVDFAHSNGLSICIGDQSLCKKPDKISGFHLQIGDMKSTDETGQEKAGNKTTSFTEDRSRSGTEISAAQLTNEAESFSEPDEETETENKTNEFAADGEREFPTQRYPSDKQPPYRVPHILIALEELKTWPISDPNEPGKSIPAKNAEPTGTIKKNTRLNVLRYFEYSAEDENGHVYEVKPVGDFNVRSFFISADRELTALPSEVDGETQPTRKSPDFSGEPLPDNSSAEKFDVTSPTKRRKVKPFNMEGACSEIKERVKQNSNRYPSRKLVRHSFTSKGKNKNHPGTTRYFTPIFDNLTDTHFPSNSKAAKKKYEYWCKNIEGACIVGDTLHAYKKTPINLEKGKENETKKDKEKRKCKFGFGNGGKNNETNCLDPCVTVAADQSRKHLKSGNVVYMPEMDGKICPQTGTRINGCFIIGDVGGWIKGPGNFDLFAGECFNYDGGVCNDLHMSAFKLRAGNTFHVIPADDELAKSYREERDEVIRNEWK